jgi:hypothetical protein
MQRNPDSGKSNLAVSNKKYILIQATKLTNPISIARLYPILGKRRDQKETIAIGNP